MKPLKFKEIRKSIINTKESFVSEASPNKSPLRRNLFGQNDAEMSFKSIKESTMSPLKPIDMNIQNNQQFSTNKKSKFLFEESSAERQNLSPLSNKKRISQIQRSKGYQNFDSEKKVFNYQRITTNFGSGQKQNCQKSVYLGKENKENYNLDGGSILYQKIIKDKKLNTGRQNINDPSCRLESSINPMNETSKNSTPGSLAKKNSCGMLFKTALQTSNKKKTLRNHLDSERSNGRQSSIGRLKQKLFGMKKIISEKEAKPTKEGNNEGEQTRSFSIYTDNTANPTNNKIIKNKQKCGERRNEAQTEREGNIKNIGEASFSNLVFTSINKGIHKPVFKHFMNEVKQENNIEKPPMNDSCLDSVNISMRQSWDSILDMSPNI